MASSLLLALKARCPRCRKGPLYDGMLKVADHCAACGSDLSKHDSGDGPAAFSIFVAGSLALIMVAWMEIRFMPPLWVYGVVLVPVVIFSSLLSIRFFKAFLVISRYRYPSEKGGHER